MQVQIGTSNITLSCGLCWKQGRQFCQKNTTIEVFQQMCIAFTRIGDLEKMTETTVVHDQLKCRNHYRKKKKNQRTVEFFFAVDTRNLENSVSCEIYDKCDVLGR